MGIILVDRFDRSAGSLGGSWTEQAGGLGTSNFSTNGDFAQIDTPGVFHRATAVGSTAASNWVQCWCRPKTNNNAGLIARFVDNDNFYFFFINNAGRVVLLRRRLGVTSATLATSLGATATVGDWNLISAIVSGSRIRIFLNGQYNQAASSPHCPSPCEGPVIDFTDGTPVTGSGAVGIVSSGNNATGSSGPEWNDFRCNDNERGQVIYVTSTGTNGYGTGEIDGPMPGLSFGLNNCGCIAGSKIKFTDAGPYQNSGATNSEYSIGHAGKFDVPGFVFPTYSDDTGEVLDAGTPNLVIEGADGATRTVLQENTGLQPFFRLEAGARGVVFRGLNFEATNLLRAVYMESSSSSDHSYSIDKCRVQIGPNAGATPFIITAACTAVRSVFSYCPITGGTLGAGVFQFSSLGATRSSLFRMLFVDGNADFAVNYTQLMPTWQSGDVHDCDHITFRTTARASTTKAGVAILQPNLIVAGSRLTIQNTITFISTPAAGSVGYGAYFGNTNVPGGTMEEHHNGFDGTDLDACTGPPSNASTNHANTTCNINAGTPALDPMFRNPTGTFTWLHTGGAGLNGEGTFAPLVVPDLRVDNTTHYRDQADDSTPLQLLDKGALQDYAVPAFPSAGGSEPPAALEDVYCVSVIFDPGGLQEYDLSTLFKEAAPIRLEKDVLLRQYRAQDVQLVFADPEELFNETNPISFLINPSTGNPEWAYKRVEVQARIGTLVLLRFVGFVLDVDGERGQGILRLANRFQELTDRPVKANQMGKIVSTTGATGNGPVFDPTNTNAPTTGTFLGTINNGPSGVAGLFGPPAQTYTITFHDGGSSSTFSISGSVTGFEGTGQLGVPFSWVSATGHLSINPAVGGDFILDSPGNPARGSTCTFEVLWRPTQGQTIIEAFLQFLADPLGPGLTAAELDLASFTALQGGIADQTLPNIGAPNVARLAATEGNCLDALNMFALHAGCVLVETSQAKLGLSSFLPVRVGSVHTLCNSEDVMVSSFTHLPIYNEFAVQHTFEERTGQYRGGGIFPAVADNDSQDRYQRRLPAPNQIAFRGYDSSNAAFIEALVQALYLRFKDPPLVVPLTATVERLDAELTTIYRLDTLVPTMQVPFVEPYEIEKEITGGLTTKMKLMANENVLSDECGGFLALDSPGKGLDDPCWRLL